jgi:hypothetical protein
MRRGFLAFLVLLMAVQFSWTAAASYCGHEASDQKAPHFGHHSHSHDHGDDHSDDEAPQTPGEKEVMLAADVDHAHCHLSPLALAWADGLGLLPPGSSPPGMEAPRRVESHFPEGLERPRWLRA